MAGESWNTAYQVASDGTLQQAVGGAGSHWFVGHRGGPANAMDLNALGPDVQPQGVVRQYNYYGGDGESAPELLDTQLGPATYRETNLHFAQFYIEVAALGAETLDVQIAPYGNGQV